MPTKTNEEWVSEFGHQLNCAVKTDWYENKIHIHESISSDPQEYLKDWLRTLLEQKDKEKKEAYKQGYSDGQEALINPVSVSSRATPPLTRQYKRMKHFLGWLFRYCPYGHGCPPKYPFKKDDHDHGTDVGGGGC